jgi:hypothetical protein
LAKVQTVDERLENYLANPGEKIPDSIRIIRTDKKFDGDYRVETYGIPLTINEVTWNFFLFFRNDGNNPYYRHGIDYGWKYLDICKRDNTPHPEPEIRSQILKELREGN